MKKIFIFFTLSLLLFSGCGSTSPAPVLKKAALPAWVDAPLPSDTATTMYGLGIAKNREDAIRAALNDMISRLSITIESSYKSKEKVLNNYYTSSVTTNEIKSTVAKIKINNYEVIKSHRLSYREFAVMIATDKQKFAGALQKEIETEKKAIKQQLKALANKDTISRYNTIKRVLKNSKTMLTKSYVLSSINAHYNIQADNDFVLALQKQFEKAANSLRFYVTGDKKSALFVEKIKNDLTKKGFTLASTRTNAIIIKLTTKEQISGASIKIVTLTVHVSLYEKRKPLGGKINILKERYNGSLANVYKNAAIHFEQDLEEKGISEILGIYLGGTSKKP